MLAIIIAATVGVLAVFLDSRDTRVGDAQHPPLGRLRVVVLTLSVLVFLGYAVFEPSTRYPGLMFALLGGSLLVTRWRRLWFGAANKT